MNESKLTSAKDAYTGNELNRYGVRDPVQLFSIFEAVPTGPDVKSLHSSHVAIRIGEVKAESKKRYGINDTDDVDVAMLTKFEILDPRTSKLPGEIDIIYTAATEQNTNDLFDRIQICLSGRIENADEDSVNFAELFPMCLIMYNHNKWHMGEDDQYCCQVKLDGNQARWDGWRELLISKGGVAVAPPREWACYMPKGCIHDGKLYYPNETAVVDTATQFKGKMSMVSRVWRARVPLSHDGRSPSVVVEHWAKLIFYAFDTVGLINGATINGVKASVKVPTPNYIADLQYNTCQRRSCC